MTRASIDLPFYPFGSRILRLSYPLSKGSDIWLLQRWLNRLRWLQPTWSMRSVPEDGVLSNLLMMELRQLSKHMLVWQPWEIGELTYLLWGQQIGRFLPAPYCFGSRILLVGDEGHDVWVLQNRLVSANRRYALILGRPADGVFDRRTARLVRVFQRRCQSNYPNLKVTGQVQMETLLALWDRTILGGRQLGVGNRGLDVLALQQLLQGMGYTLPTSGIFDQLTAAALSAWQTKCGLSATGCFAATDCWRLGLERGY